MDLQWAQRRSDGSLHRLQLAGQSDLPGLILDRILRASIVDSIVSRIGSRIDSKLISFNFYIII